MVPTRIGAATLLGGALVLAGCASNTATVAPQEPTPPPSPTPTIGLSVAITVQPTRVPRPRPTPTATRFVPPAGPWMYLRPNQGPPASGNITVVAGNLPPRAAVTVTWSQTRRGAPLTLDVLTGPNGNLRTPFSVPAAPPGYYRIAISRDGTLLGQSLYHVISRASLVAKVLPTPGGDRFTLSGHRFLPRVRLLLAAYPLFAGAHAFVLGTARADASGNFTFQVVTRKAVPGEYIVRAFSVGTLAAQVAETYAEVTV